MKEIEKQRKIDALTETLGEFFETVQNDIITKSNLNLIEGNAATLKKQLKSEEARINKTTALFAARAKGIVDFDTDKIIEKGKQGTRMLIRNALSEYSGKVQRIHRLEKVMPLREAIFKQTQEGIDKGVPVTYKNGRKVGYKEYMEMNVRTTLQQNIGEKQLELGKEANVVFYICNTYADCADDHADYQGKIYYDERYKVFSLKSDIQNEITKHIRSNNMMSVQEAREGEPYLTTRPNCRHTFTPISIDQALNIDPKTLVNDLNLARGSYKPKNYKDMQEQRYNERMIRKYKSRKEINEALLAKDPSNELLKKQITQDSTRVRQWQKAQRQHVASNGVLERDYRKETRAILLKDLGAKYNLRSIPTTVNTPQTPPQLTVQFGDMPAIWSNFKGKTKVGFEKTWVKYTERIKTVEKQYGYDEQREKIAAFYKRYDKLFPTSKITLAKEGGEHYDPNYNTVNIRFLDSDTKSENRVITTVIHEFGHAIDNNITTKILKGDRIAISQGMWREEQEIIDSYATFKNKVSATALQNMINYNIQKIRDRVAGYNEDQKRLYNASNEFSYAVQDEIKKGLDNARNTELYKKIREFDKIPRRIRVMHEEHPDWEEANNNLKQVSREITTIRGYESSSQRIKDANISQYELAYEKSHIKGLEDEFGKLGIDINNLDEEKKKREAIFLERKDRVDNIIESYNEKKVAAKKEYEEKSYYSQGSDFLDAISLGRFQGNFELTYGHGTKYYKKNKGKSEVEIFTHLSTTSVADPDVYKMIKNEFPKIVEKFEELINISYELMEDDINGKV